MGVKFTFYCILAPFLGPSCSFSRSNFRPKTQFFPISPKNFQNIEKIENHFRKRGKNGWKLSKSVKKWLQMANNVYEHMFLELKSSFVPKITAPSAQKCFGLRAVGTLPPLGRDHPYNISDFVLGWGTEKMWGPLGWGILWGGEGAKGA